MVGLAKGIAPVALAVLLALLPAPEGLPQHAWYFTAIFAGVVLALVLEPIPGALIGLVGVTVVTVLAPWVLYAPDQLTRPGFRAANAALSWALSGFANGTVWLIFAAFMFALGYDKSGLGRRIALLLVRALGRRTLTLGYAIALADLALAPFTPSNTARSGGTIYPIVRNLPPLYDSKPDDPSARRIGGYVMWTAIAATCVTSSMFLTALAPNLLAVELAGRTARVTITWFEWFLAFLPVGLILLVAVPLLAFRLYPPEVTRGEEVVAWAGAELARMGGLTRQEVTLAVLVVVALALWVFGESFINGTTVALAVLCGIVLTGVVKWDDVLANRQAWNTLVWFATLVALAGGLAQVGFVAWFAGKVGGLVAGVPPTTALVALVVVFYLAHYAFASVTAHVTALLPVMLTVGAAVPGMDMKALTLCLCLTLGIMGVLTPYATGPSPVYYGSGYLPSGDYWRLGAIFGAIFLLVMLVVGVPWVLAIT
ncbi:DASS family sodium-coupled anion symporter [Falsiroseomonas oryzae]|uniref:DASS family sodium-coupled anion symporter n=1 Tax=Falsiroseomonas oryzae TaxID=2766473 RepID=UPI0022EB7DF8|nr:DASS family sodium-coupled anion symporter [Roseomonas sp. MO-31]